MAAQNRKARILVADDHPSLRSLLRTALVHFGYAVTVCRDGRTVLHRMESAAYDLLLLDYRMGALTGFDVLATLRTRGVQVPVVLMSSCFPEETRAACARLVNVSVLHKPFSLAALRKTVARHLTRR